MPFRKKTLYYGLMLCLTLLALEGMARIAYYAAYGPGYGHGGAGTPLVDTPLPATALAAATEPPKLINHPFYGHTGTLPGQPLNAMPPAQRREDLVIIGLVGGSVARQVQPFLETALRRWFAAHNRPRQPAVLGLATGGQKQPQQALIVASLLQLGGEFDLIINLDGLNEIASSTGWNPESSLFPFFPHWWNGRVKLTAAEILLLGRLAELRQDQARLTSAGETPWLRWSALFGLVNRYRQERTAADIIRLNHELAAAESAYSLAKHGPRNGLAQDAELLPEAARVWYRGSLALARLAELAGTEYYHFLQPNQYAPNSKPLSPEELERAYRTEGIYGSFAARGYPLLTGFNQELTSQGVNFFDLTGIFLDHQETLYRDDCCHLNSRGNELLAAAMVQRLEPALLRLGGESPAPTVSALAAARRPPEPDRLLIDANFRVYLQGDGKYLRYGRAGCTPAEVESRFFLHLTPRDRADLPPYRRDHGFDNLDFSFGEAGGRLWRGQCLTQIRLPDYPIQTLRTGQYAPEAAVELWAGSYSFPE